MSSIQESPQASSQKSLGEREGESRVSDAPQTPTGVVVTKARNGEEELRPDQPPRQPPVHAPDASSAATSPAGSPSAPAATRRPRGFAAIDRKLLSEIARKGGKAAHSAGTAHEFTSDEARAAGRKGGLASHAKRRVKTHG